MLQTGPKNNQQGVVFMSETILNVLIADDEVFIREGLKYLIDWQTLGFEICGEAQDGMDALEKMTALHPNLVLLDIQMPLLSGIELIQTAREQGFQGEFIILSGYSDFRYAQAAIAYGVSRYLTKPIDEDLLAQAVLSAKEKILERLRTENAYYRYLVKAKNTVLRDLLTQPCPDSGIHYEEFGFTFPVYQIILYEELEQSQSPSRFGEIFAAVCGPKDKYELLSMPDRELLLLKGHSALTRFQTFLSRCQEQARKSSPLDTVFLACSRPVFALKDLHAAYLECCLLMERRFFTPASRHVLTTEDLPVRIGETHFSSPGNAANYARQLADSVKSANRRRMEQTLDELEAQLNTCPDSPAAVKHFLTDILLQVRQLVMQTYDQVRRQLSSNAVLLEQMEQYHTLPEIISEFSEQFEQMIQLIGSDTDGEGIFENILDYIDHNYGEPLRLETIAPLFGYNSSYLGKLFTQRAGRNFNSYLNEVRIRNAARQLLETNLTISAVASAAGYRTLDYFYQKFKQIYHCSPAEYRRNHGGQAENP